MRLTLRYEGELPPSGNKPKPKHVWHIRRTLHPQVAQLFREHPVVSEMAKDAQPFFPKTAVKGFDFIPLVQRRQDMICTLKITFLRKVEGGGLVYQGGDIDNRIKTLLDGLRMPDQGDDVPANEVQFNPMYTLLESDTLVTGFEVKTDRLLDGDANPINWVHMLIEAHISVKRVTWANAAFLGD